MRVRNLLVNPAADVLFGVGVRELLPGKCLVILMVYGLTDPLHTVPLVRGTLVALSSYSVDVFWCKSLRRLREI